MKAVIVHESLWGNTGAIARAIAEGLGPGGSNALRPPDRSPACRFLESG